MEMEITKNNVIQKDIKSLNPTSPTSPDNKTAYKNSNDNLVVITSTKTSSPINIKELLDSDPSPLIPKVVMHRFSIAPMMDVTNVHFRFFMRLLSKHCTLWTEMVHTNALIHNEKQRDLSLRMNEIEHPVVLQLGGNDPESLAQGAIFAEKYGFDEVNINCGCPSPRVTSGSFGACLMKSPAEVAACVKKMQEAVKIPVHVKCRIGVDDQDSYEFTKNFVKIIGEVGCTHFLVHARKAFLKGLNPKENRTIPPLNYDTVVQLAKDFPDYQFTINGGFKKLDDIESILKPENKLIGCMVGRLAYENPWELKDVDRRFYGLENPGLSRREILLHWAEYGNHVITQDPKTKYPSLTKPIINLFLGEQYSGVYRRYISDRKNQKASKNFKEFIYTAIETLNKFNTTALDEKPP